MAKSGIGADAVAGMCHAELSAWLADVLQSLGAKVPTDDCVAPTAGQRPPTVMPARGESLPLLPMTAFKR